MYVYKCTYVKMNEFMAQCARDPAGLSMRGPGQ